MMCFHCCLFFSAMIQTTKVPQVISVTTVQLGESGIFNCLCSTDDRYFYLYKQPLGCAIQTIATGVYSDITISEQFNNSRFSVTKVDAQYIFTIRGITKEDEALYFCQSGNNYELNFMNSTFLAVKDQTNEQKFISVEQNPPAASVQRGHSVNLQCSLLSEDKQNPVQCPGEHNVYWFRAGSGGYRPGVIYTRKNKTEEQDERKCIYRLSKTVQDSSDSGTYYCAVATCGQILFGGGTKVETDQGGFIIAFGVLLACCVTVIVILGVLLGRRRVCEHCKGTTSISHLERDKSRGNLSEDLDDETNEVNYTALTFSARRTRQGYQKTQEQDCVYSAVGANYHT
uniref:Ig-like domain-containing protein n=1 Tax=Sphaeramia orbicularis TaxID=375764 RepID=A0A672ZR31_9TELE